MGVSNQPLEQKQPPSQKSFKFLLVKVAPLQVGYSKLPELASLHAHPARLPDSPPHPGRGTAVGCARQALRELRSGGGGCSRRPGGRRREAVPQFVSNQGVRAVPRAGQQCVNKPSGNSSAPLARSPRAHRRRLRRRHRHRHRGLGCRRPLPHIPPPSAPLPPRGHPDPPPAQLAPRHPALLRPRPRGLLTYRPTRARSCTTRPVRPARNVASRELGKSDARGPRGWLPGFGNFLARLFFRWALG